MIRVTGLTDTDYGILWTAAETAGVPAVGSNLGTGKEYLFLTKRIPRLVSKGTVDIELVYMQSQVAWDYTFMSGDFNTDDIWPFEGDTSLQQTEHGQDLDGNFITVSYTYPDDHPTRPGQTPPDQGGTISVLSPTTVLRTAGILYADYPDEITRTWTGSVNADLWAGDAPGYWLCTHCGFEPVNMYEAVPAWHFRFEFTYNWQGWQPFVWWQDPETGKMPGDLVADVGYKEVTWYPEMDFNWWFPI